MHSSMKSEIGQDGMLTPVQFKVRFVRCNEIINKSANNNWKKRFFILTYRNLTHPALSFRSDKSMLSTIFNKTMRSNTHSYIKLIAFRKTKHSCSDSSEFEHHWTTSILSEVPTCTLN
jgi:hypothetical protein